MGRPSSLLPFLLDTPYFAAQFYRTHVTAANILLHSLTFPLMHVCLFAACLQLGSLGLVLTTGLTLAWLAFVWRTDWTVAPLYSALFLCLLFEAHLLTRHVPAMWCLALWSAIGGVQFYVGHGLLDSAVAEREELSLLRRVLFVMHQTYFGLYYVLTQQLQYVGVQSRLYSSLHAGR